MKHQKTPRAGYLYIIIAATLWAVSGTSSKFLFNRGVTPQDLVQLRLVISTVLLFGFLLIYKPSLIRISAKDIWRFILLGTVGMAAIQYTYFFAISRINVGIAILLEYLSSIFIVLYTLFFTREKLSLVVIMALAGTISGCYLVVGAYNTDILTMNSAGIIAGVCCALAFAYYTIQGEVVMRKYEPVTVLFYALIGAVFVWNLVLPPFKSFASGYSYSEWGVILYIGVLGTAIPFSLYFKGVKMIRSARANITSTLEPIIAGLISFVFLGETMEALQLAGALLVISSIILLQLNHELDDKTPDIARRKPTGHSPEP